MKLLKTGLLSLATLALASAHAQTADDIISKHLDAIGGTEKLKSITSVKLDNTMNIMGNDVQNTTTILNGKGYRNESDFGGQKIIQAFSDKGGWMVNPMMGATDPQSLPEEAYKAGQYQIYAVPLLDYASRGGKVELLGQEKTGSTNAYKLKLTDKNNTVTTYYIDPSTYYIIQQVSSAEMMGQQMDVITSFSDFKKTEYGWVVPQTIEINMGGQFSMTGKLNSIEINKEVDPKIFELPGK
jgi:hypothetical protein